MSPRFRSVFAISGLVQLVLYLRYLRTKVFWISENLQGGETDARVRRLCGFDLEFGVRLLVIAAWLGRCAIGQLIITS